MRRLLAVALATLVAPAFGAAASGPPDVAQSYLFSPAGKLTPLSVGVVYRASEFPLPLRVTTPDAGWGGAQWKANLFNPDRIHRQHLTCASNPKVCAPPYYGWVTIGMPVASPMPRVLIVILSSFSRTPSVATIATQLCRPHFVACQSPEPVTLAGFHGLQLDGRTNGPGTHLLIPFTRPAAYAGKAYGDGAADLIYVEGAHPFHATVLNIRGKSVLILVGTQVLSADAFTAFLPRADRLLRTLRFPNAA
jgi:hypothetical protein